MSACRTNPCPVPDATAGEAEANGCRAPGESRGACGNRVSRQSARGGPFETIGEHVERGTGSEGQGT